MFAPGSKNRLTRHDLGRFQGATLFDRLARAVCAAECLPRKELYEAWEMARRTRRFFRGGRVVDVAGGHGLLALALLLLDRTSPEAVIVDPDVPASASTVYASLVETWPHLNGRVAFMRHDLASVPLSASDLIVSCHACGDLTDRVLAAATAVGARVSVLPCCHDATTCSSGALRGWMDLGLAVDTMRAVRLEQAGYQVRTLTIPADITPKHRLLLASPGRDQAEVTRAEE